MYIGEKNFVYLRGADIIMERKYPKVSIIVPAYNVEKYISTGIESVLNQTYKNIELVIVDDGSKDNTASIIENYANNNSKIKFISQENKGVSSARNKALKHATGEYLIFLDSDDWLESNTIEYLIDLWNNNQTYLISGDCFFAYLGENGDIRKERHREKKETIVIDRECALLNTGTGVYNLQSSCYKLYSKQIIDDNNICFSEDISHGEDGLFVFKYLHHVDGMVYSTEPLWNILERPNSATTAPYNEKWLTAIDAVKEMLQYESNTNELEQKLKVFLVQRTITVMLACIRTGKKEKKAQRYLRSILKEYKSVYLNSELSAHDRLLYFVLTKAPFVVLRILF